MAMFNEILGRFVFVLPCVWIRGGAWIGGGCGTAAASLSSWYLKSKFLIPNLIFLFFLRDKFLISAATIMPNKSSLIGVDCIDLLMPSIISNSLLDFSVDLFFVWPLLYFFFTLQFFSTKFQMIGWSKHSKINSFRSNHWNCLQPQSCHRCLD